MIPQLANSDKIIFTAIQNQTHITCPFNREDLSPSVYWLTLGLKDRDNYLNFGKQVVSVYQKINITAVEPRYILSKSEDANVEVYGNFEGLMQYFGAHKNFERVKVNFTGISNGNRSIKYFDIYSLTKERLTVRLGSMKNLVFIEDPYIPTLGIYDL